MHCQEYIKIVDAKMLIDSITASPIGTAWIKEASSTRAIGMRRTYPTIARTILRRVISATMEQVNHKAIIRQT